MHLLQSGVPFNVIALWLGHESTTTTHRYVEAPRDEGEGPREAGGTRFKDGTLQSSGLAYAIPSDAITMHRLRWPRRLAAIGANAMRAQSFAHSCDLSIETAMESFA